MREAQRGLAAPQLVLEDGPSQQQDGFGGAPLARRGGGLAPQLQDDLGGVVEEHDLHEVDGDGPVFLAGDGIFRADGFDSEQDLAVGDLVAA